MLTFQDLLNDKGDAFIDKLFNMPVTVYEKLDASQFSFERDASGKFSFFKQGQSNPISKIDVTLSQYYTPAIKHVQNLSANIADMIPINWKFCCEYFIDRSPVYISYDEIPKNNLVLINIIETTLNGKKVIDDLNILKEWADLLEIDQPPILFQGNLSEKQKLKIMEFVKTPKNELLKKFDTDSFIKHIISILSPDKKNSFLRKDVDGLVEGVVFKFGDQEDTVIAKIIDPVFYSKKIENRPNSSGEPSDVYWLTLIDLVEYIQGIDIKFIDVEGSDPDERYIDLVCKLYNGFIEKYGNKYIGVDFELPKFMRKDAFRVGFDYIPNKKTSEYVRSHDSWQNVFKIIIAALRKKKKESNRLFTPYVLNRFNITVNEIKDICNTVSVEEDDNEIGLLTFDEMKRYGRINDVVESDESSHFHEIEADNSPASLQLKAFLDDGQEYSERDSQKVNVIIDTFEFFTNEHYNELVKAKEKNGNPVILINIRTPHNLTNEDVQNRVLSSVEREYPELIENIMKVRTSDISEILATLIGADYEPVSIIVQSNMVDYFEKQCKTSDAHGAIFEITSMDKDPDYSKIYSFVMNDSWAEFRKYVPTVVINYFESFKIKEPV